MGSISTQKGTMGSSMALNNQKGPGAIKPSEKGKHNPGNTHPGMEAKMDAPSAVRLPGKPQYLA